MARAWACQTGGDGAGRAKPEVRGPSGARALEREEQTIKIANVHWLCQALGFRFVCSFIFSDAVFVKYDLENKFFIKYNESIFWVLIQKALL